MESDGAYQIPQTIYVGESGQLVFPLPEDWQTTENLTRTDPALPENEEITVTKVEIDSLNQRLLVTFRAWTPGQVEIPAFFADSHLFEGLSVTISSVLEAEAEAGKSSLILSPQAPPIAAPGTVWLASSIFITVILVVFGIFSIIKGKKAPLFRLLTLLRKRRLRRIARRTLIRLKVRLETDGKAKTLERLSTEFRAFVSLYTGVNCRSLVPAEFLNLDLAPFSSQELSRLFARCDLMRFSGQEISPRDILDCLQSAADVIFSLEQNESSHTALDS